MKISTHIFLLILVSVLLQFSCSYCNRVRCEGGGDTIKLQLLREGKNILFGPDPIIEKDQLVVFSLVPNLFEGSIGYLDSSQAISFYVYPNAPVVLEINGVRADTFTITTEVTSMGECCKGYTTTSVSHNGQVICAENCEEILAVEI